MSINTEEAVWGMLTQSTGRSLCDSGGIYGRHWERNAGKTLEDFRDAPEVTMDFRFGVEVTIDVFHFLSKALVYDDEMQDRYYEFVESLEEDADEDADEWGFIAHLQAASPQEMDSGQNTDYLRDEARGTCYNTYNGEDALSQVIQHTAFEYDGEEYIALRIHQGCDVRGGYTEPLFFTTDPFGDHSIYDNATAHVCCDKCDANWGTHDAGYSWSSDCQDVCNLEEYELEGVSDDGTTATCPCCNEGKLYGVAY